MFKTTVARQAAKALSRSSRPAAFAAPPWPSASNTFFRSLSYTIPRRKDEKKDLEASADVEGGFARTDESVVIKYPDDAQMPRTPIVQGRGGMHFKRTLAQFSLENKVSLVTGGARGLGLVMSQALVASGSDLAIVDLNREFQTVTCNRCVREMTDCATGKEAEESAQKLVEQFKKENPGLEQ